MTPNGACILANPSPGGQIIYPYTDGNLVGNAVCHYASAGLRSGEGLILIMTAAHSEPIKQALLAEGWDARALEDSGQLTCRIAEEMLSGFMSRGEPNERRFKAITTRLIRAARTSTGLFNRVRIFDEMVCLLWNTNLAAARRLEQLWNDVISASSASLLCTYALAGASGTALLETPTVGTHRLALLHSRREQVRPHRKRAARPLALCAVAG